MRLFCTARKLLFGLVFLGLLIFQSQGHAFKYTLKWAISWGHEYPSSHDYGFPAGQYTEHYVTQGNNLQVILQTSGQNRVWVEQKAVLWPRGSGEIYVRYPGLCYGAVGQFDTDEQMDTSYSRANDQFQHPGRMARNYWWRDTGELWKAQMDLDGDGSMDLPIGDIRMRISTRAGDLDGWPPEFRTDVDGDGKGDISGDPIVMSDEDIAGIFNRGYCWRVVGKEIEQMSRAVNYEDYGPDLPVQFEQRVLSFGHPAAQDIQFHLVTMRNMSKWNFWSPNDNPSLGPVTTSEPTIPESDFNGMLVGEYANTGLGNAYMGYQPAMRLLFTFDRDFIDAGFRDQVGFIGMLILHTPEVDGKEIDLTVASSGTFDSAPWNLWGTRIGMEPAWNWMRAAINVEFQNPGPNPGGIADIRSDSTIYIANRSSTQMYALAQSDDLVVPPDSAVQFDFAWLCAYPLNNPVLDNSDEGVVREAAGLVKLSQLAYQLYETGYRLPKSPTPPNLKLIPGNRKVTITWDDLSIKTPDPFLPADDPAQGFRQYDFEGFRVYRSRTGQVTDAELLAQYDLRNGITLVTGIKDKTLHVFLEDGTEADMPSPSAQDTLGASPFDKQKRFGLGQDTGIKFAYVDQWDEAATFQRLTNGFRYFYVVTAYDWNMGESLESPIVFTEKNMVVPRSDANTYRSAEIELGVMYDGAGNELDPLADAVVPVEMGKVLGSAVPTNTFADAEVVINNAKLIGTAAEYRIRVDSIIGGPGPIENHLLDPTFDSNLWQTVYVSLLDGAGRVVSTDLDQMKIDVDEFKDFGDYTDGHFLLTPTPDSGRGVPFSVEFDLQGFDFNLMHVNEVEILQGQTDPADIKVKLDYANGNNNLPPGFRAADFEIQFVDYGSDSVSLEVEDLTHNVDVPFLGYPGAGWCFFNSWSRFVRLMKGQLREDLTYDDVYGGGPKLSWSFERYSASDFPLTKAAKVRIHLCGLQIAVSSKSPPVPGDKWLVRTNYGTLPDSIGDLAPMSPRPPVSGVSYGIQVTPAVDSEENLDLKRIRVVPNPFIIRTPWDQSPLSKEIQFINLPNRCKIKIYTLSGHLVQVLDHDGAVNAYTRNWQGGTLIWNLQNRFNVQIASGWYIWHATDLDTGKKEMGKFAVIQ